MGSDGWIEIVLFYGVAIGFGVWQFWSMDRKLKKTRAEREAKEAAARNDEPTARCQSESPADQPQC